MTNSQTTARETFQKIIGVHVAPLLKQHGYKSSGPTFYLQQGRNWGLINFQALQLTGASNLHFTINIAVVSGRLWHFYYPERSNTRPLVSEADYQQRAGFLLPERTDKWWSIDADTDPSQLGPEIKDIIASTILPTIEHTIDDESLLRLWSSGNSPGLSPAMRQQNLSLLTKLI